MKVTPISESHLVEAAQPATPENGIRYTIRRCTGEVVYGLHCVARMSPTPVLWPAPAGSPEAAEDERLRREWSQKLALHFHNMRRCARANCPLSLLPQFEDQLCEIEANIRAAVTGRLMIFVDLTYHIRLIEEFRDRWVPYVDPPPLPPPPPPRLRYDREDHSLWIDGRCVAKELDRKQFGFVSALVNAYPEPVKWSVISKTVSGCRGGNQTRLRASLPPAIENLIEGGPDGYAIRLPERLSTAV
jgi:hypothetical protein